MVTAVRRGQSLRAVARQFGVGVATVAHWVERAQGQRLDRVDWSDRPSVPQHTRRTNTALEDLILKIREELAPGDFVFCPEGRAGQHAFSNPHEEPARILGISAGSFPDVVAYPEHGYAWVATRDPDPELLAKAEDPGIIARFEIPVE